MYIYSSSFLNQTSFIFSLLYWTLKVAELKALPVPVPSATYSPSPISVARGSGHVTKVQVGEDPTRLLWLTVLIRQEERYRARWDFALTQGDRQWFLTESPDREFTEQKN